MHKSKYSSEYIDRLKRYLAKLAKNESKIDYKKIKNIFDFLHRDVKDSGAGMNIKDIAKLLKKDRRTISTWFRRLGLGIRNVVPMKVGVLVETSSTPYTTKENGIKIKKIPFTASEDLMWVLGFALADGSFSSGALEIGNVEFRLLPILKKMLSKYGSTSVIYDLSYMKRKLHTYRKNVSRPSANYFRIKLYNTAFGRIIKNELATTNKDTVNFAASKEKWVKQFIAGLWDADGWVFWGFYERRDNRHKRPELCISIGFSQKQNTESEWLIRNLRNLLKNRFGIKTRKTKNKVKSRFVKSDRSYSYETQMIGFVVATRESMLKWLTEFKGYLKHPGKKRKINEILYVLENSR